MRGQWNGLQALFLKECKYAYYVHCFAHRLQLDVVKTAETMGPIWKFYSMLTSTVNLVTASSHRFGDFQSAQEEEIEKGLANGELETGKGANQIGTLRHATDTRWSSHYGSGCNLIDKFEATCTTIDHIGASDPNVTAKVGEAQSISEEMRSLRLVFVLHLMYKIMGITEILCQFLQKKTLDIVNVMSSVSTTKALLRELREDGWEDFITTVVKFCGRYDVHIPNMEARYMEGMGRSCQQRDNITVDHHYRVDIFNATIDCQLLEVDCRFPEDTIELLILSSCLDPRDSFKSFNVDSLCDLSKKFYPLDLSPQQVYILRNELQHYGHDVVRDLNFKNLSSVSELCRKLVSTKKAEAYPMIDRLIRIVLTLPVSTATAERYFSTMKLVKTAARNKMEEDFLRDCMMIYIEREIAGAIDIDSIIDEFDDMYDHRVPLRY
ncbi:uncharacterized protein LOC113324736 [Papaver somniferum]|uniref:uncharacterized protein LOC113324736 n=1 Tax=Papaver somniferum TaxID=3469 RepID=UPI000E6FB2DA|nr:uncharacterized protein LOC113324736 [Papaver somniferum]